MNLIFTVKVKGPNNIDYFFLIKLASWTTKLFDI